MFPIIEIDVEHAAGCQREHDDGHEQGDVFDEKPVANLGAGTAGQNGIARRRAGRNTCLPFAAQAGNKSPIPHPAYDSKAFLVCPWRGRGLPPHSTTSSARNRNESGMVRPIALAAFRFTAISNLVGCSTGRSPGFAPLKILSTKAAARK